MVNLSDFTFHKDSLKMSPDEVMRKLIFSRTVREKMSCDQHFFSQIYAVTSMQQVITLNVEVFLSIVKSLFCYFGSCHIVGNYFVIQMKYQVHIANNFKQYRQYHITSISVCLVTW